MADQFQIPQRTPPAPQFTPPDGIIRDYLNYQRELPFRISGQVHQGINDYLDYQMKQQQLKAAAFGEGGPTLMNMLYGKGQQGAQGAPPAPKMGPANPAIVGQSPQGDQSQASPVAPNPYGVANGWDQPSAQPQSQASSALNPSAQTLPAQADNQPSEAIHASVQILGHPDYAGHVAKMSQLQTQMDDADQQFGASNWGMKTQQQITGRMAAEKAIMDAQQVPLNVAEKQGSVQHIQNENSLYPLDVASRVSGIRAQAAKFFTPAQNAAIASGDPSAIAAAFQGQGSPGGANIPAEAATLVSGQRQAKQDKAGSIEKDYQNKNSTLIDAIKAIDGSLDLKRKAADVAGPVVGRGASVVAEESGGKYQNPTYQLNHFNELQRSTLQGAQDVNRFNPQEVGFIGGGAFAQPKEPLQTSTDKAAQAKKVLISRLGQNLNEKMAQYQALGLPSPLSEHDGKALKWAQKNYTDPRALAILSKLAAPSLGGQ